jgi:hypothetical protein
LLSIEALKSSEPLIAGTLYSFDITAADYSEVPVYLNTSYLRIFFDGPNNVHYNVLASSPTSATVWFNATTAGHYDVNVTYPLTSVVTFSIFVACNEFSIQNSDVHRASDVVHAGQPFTFELAAKDAFDNLAQIGGSVFEVFVIALVPSSVDTEIQSTIEDLNNGTYRITWSATLAGTYKINAGNPNPQNQSIFDNAHGSPFFVSVLYDTSNAENTGIIGLPQAGIVKAGDAANVIVSEKDKYGNLRYAVDPAFNLSASILIAASGKLEALGIKNLNNGSYILYTGKWFSMVGEFDLRISVGESTITEFHYTVVAGNPSPQTSIVAHNFAMGGEVGEPVEFTIQLKDRFGNSILKGGNTSQLDVQALHPGVQPIRCILVDLNDGQYSANFVPTFEGDFSVFVSWLNIPVAGSPFKTHVTAGE